MYRHRQFRDIDFRALGQWDFQVEYIEPKGRVYRLETDTGPKCLKMLEKPFEETDWVFALTEHLAGEGIKNIPRFIRTRYNDPFVPTEGKYYFISDWINGRTISIWDEDDLAGAARQLGRLHEAAVNFRPGRQPNTSAVEQNLLKEFQHITLRLINLREKGTVDQSVRVAIDRIISQAIDACKTLETGGYSALRQQVRERGRFCHGDFQENHLIIEPGGRINITGFDQWKRESGVQDLAKFIYRAGLKNGWKGSSFKTIITNYQSAASIGKAEAAIVRAYLAFPHQSWDEIQSLASTGAKSNQLKEIAERWQYQDEIKRGFMERVNNWSEGIGGI